jgi:hypothetical protein
MNSPSGLLEIGFALGAGRRQIFDFVNLPNTRLRKRNIRLWGKNAEIPAQTNSKNCSCRDAT